MAGWRRADAAGVVRPNRHTAVEVKIILQLELAPLIHCSQEAHREAPVAVAE